VQAAVRALLYLGTIVFLGGGVFSRWIGPDLARGPARRRVRVGLIAGGVLLVAASLAEVAGAMTRALGTFDAGLLPEYLLRTQHGRAVLARIALAVLLAWVALRVSLSLRWGRAAYAALAVGLLMTFSLTSHAAGVRNIVAIAADLSHMVAAASWAGGLLYLGWAPVWPDHTSSAHPVAAAVNRVSQTGLVCVATIVATGVYASFLHLWGLPALTTSSYGRALLLKTVLVVAAIGAAGVNRWVLVPAASRPGGAARLGRMVRFESLLVVAILGVTGVLASQAPPERPSTLASVVSFDESVGPWNVQGTLTPRLPDGLEITFGVRDQAGQPAPPSVQPEVVLKMLDHSMSPTAVTLTQVAAGVYRKALALSMAGRWQVSIRFPEGTVEIMVQAQEPPAEVRARRERTNPIPFSAQSVARGRTVYQEECQACHGITGGGDGPAASGLNPRPADLRIHMAAGHTDGQLFNWISEGFTGTAMPAFKTKLSEDDRWHVINFLRTLVPQIK
jgi:putative copper resistance protein D/copper transport protein